MTQVTVWQEQIQLTNCTIIAMCRRVIADLFIFSHLARDVFIFSDCHDVARKIQDEFVLENLLKCENLCHKMCNK